jgi:hypothetical protein
VFESATKDIVTKRYAEFVTRAARAFPEHRVPANFQGLGAGRVAADTGLEVDRELVSTRLTSAAVVQFPK